MSKHLNMNPPLSIASLKSTPSILATNPTNEKERQLTKMTVLTCRAQSIKQSLQWVANGGRKIRNCKKMLSSRLVGRARTVPPVAVIVVFVVATQRGSQSQRRGKEERVSHRVQPSLHRRGRREEGAEFRHQWDASIVN